MYESDEAPELLLVEDDENDAALILSVMREATATNAIRLRDGAEAMDFLLPDQDAALKRLSTLRAIFLDLSLPKVGGLDVLRALKSSDATRTILVVMLTSSSAPENRRAAYGFRREQLRGEAARPRRVPWSTVASMTKYWTTVNVPTGPR